MRMKYLIMLLSMAVLFLISSCAQPSDAEEKIDTSYLELVAVYESEGYVLDMAVREDYVYLAEDEAGFSIFDAVTDTLVVRYYEDIFTNIKLLAVDDESGIMIVYNKYGSSTGIHLYDISDRKQPQWRIFHSGTSADINDLHVTGIDSTHFQFYWVNGQSEYYSGKFSKLDTGDGWYMIPEMLELFNYDVVNIDEDYTNGTIYCAGKQLGMKVVNKADFSTVGTVGTIGQTIAVKVVDSIAYLGNREEGISVHDISNLNSPQELFDYDTVGLASDISVSSELNVFALASTSGGVYLFQGPAGEIKRLQRIDDSEIGYTYQVEIAGSYLYVGTRYGVYKYLIVNI